MTLSLGRRAARGLALAGLTGALASAAVVVPAQASDPTVIHFQGIHIVHNLKTARRFLPGTSRDFKLFIAYTGDALRRVDREQHLPADCIRNAGVVVTAYVDGYAIGDVGDCGGYEALWTNRYAGPDPAAGYGTWSEVYGTQDGWYCAPLRKYRVPSALVGDTCYSPKLGKVLPYQQS